jgi:hypothetical protein
MGRTGAKAVFSMTLILTAVAAVMALAFRDPTPLQIRELPVARDHQTSGPLRVSEANSRYFSDRFGNPVYLTGSHTWTNLQDSGPSDPPAQFDFPAYLAFLKRYNHNFIRLWVWENSSGAPWVSTDYFVEPGPFERTGPGIAGDGKPRFDLTRFREDFFTRLRARVKAAGERGIYVSIMLFDGWSIEDKDLGLGNPWKGHPFHRDNNINNLDGDPDKDGEGEEVHTLLVPDVTAVQERYVRRVIDTVNDLDNVLYEISNESHGGSEAWQYHIIKYIREYQGLKPNQHPVGMTVEWRGGNNSDLYEGPADWISPRAPIEGKWYPNPSDGRKVIIYDSDHICGVCGYPQWVWKSFLRGVNVILMDPYDGQAIGLGVPRGYDPTEQNWERVRRQMGYALAVSKLFDLENAEPLSESCSSAFCMVAQSEGATEYLAYLPARYWKGFRLPGGGVLSIDVGNQPQSFSVQWLNPETGKLSVLDDVRGAGKLEFRSPFGSPGLLMLRSRQRTRGDGHPQ